MAARDVVGVQPIQVGNGVALTDGRKQPARHKIGPAHTRHTPDQETRHRVEDVVVGVAAAERTRGLQILQRVQRVLGGVRRVGDEQQVAGAHRQAAAVAEQVAHGHHLGDRGVVHAELAQVFHHGLVPADLAFVDQDGERRGGVGLGVRADGEAGVGVDRLRLAHRAYAITLHPGLGPGADDRHRDARHVEGLAHPFRLGVDEGGVEVQRRGGVVGREGARQGEGGSRQGAYAEQVAAADDRRRHDDSPNFQNLKLSGGRANATTKLRTPQRLDGQRLARVFWSATHGAPTT